MQIPKYGRPEAMYLSRWDSRPDVLSEAVAWPKDPTPGKMSFWR